MLYFIYLLRLRAVGSLWVGEIGIWKLGRVSDITVVTVWNSCKLRHKANCENVGLADHTCLVGIRTSDLGSFPGPRLFRLHEGKSQGLVTKVT